jgi:hypothetical protein
MMYIFTQKNQGFTLLLIFLLYFIQTINAKEIYFVSPEGNDANSGTTISNPLKTISRCNSLLHMSDDQDVTCSIQPGTYNESVAVNIDTANPNKRRTFIGTNATTLSGLDTLSNLVWHRYGNNKCIWSAQVASNLPRIQQLFYKGSMQIEARWPNIDIREDKNVGNHVLNRETWKVVGMGSSYGKIQNKELAEFNFSWAGALATLNVAHQFYTWTRNITSHKIGNDSFTYPQNLPGLANTFKNKKYWDGSCTSKCNQYFLSGVLGALDVQSEFHHDVENSILYFYPPSASQSRSQCTPPSAGEIQIKVRDYAIEVFAKVRNIQLLNLNVLGAALRMHDCENCIVENVEMKYPTFNRRSTELDVPSSTVAATSINGSNIYIHNTSLRYSNNNGLRISGENILADNILIDYTDWMGSLSYAPFHVNGNNISVRRATVRYFGNAGVVTGIPNTLPHASINSTQNPPQPMANRFLEVSHSHISNGGKIGMDTAALYTGGWQAAGTRWHHNWIHDTSEKCLRADDQSENMTVHHNVIYNCGVGDKSNINVASKQAGLGIILKGDGHVIYANTLFNTNYTEMCMPSCMEPLKPFRHQYPLIKQNQRTQIFNTAAKRDLGWPCSCHNKSYVNSPGGNVTSMFKGSNLNLEDISNYDFRPKASSSLVDAGSIIPPFTNGYIGKAPDIGAYEYGDALWWKAGCVGMEGC